MKKISFFIFLLSASLLASQELILKVKDKPCIIGWIYQKDKLENTYCLYDRNYVILANSSYISSDASPILDIFKEHEKEVISANFSFSKPHIISLDAGGKIVNRSLVDEGHTKVRDFDVRLRPSSVAISPDNKMELVGFGNGFIQIYSLLKKTQKDFNISFKAHTSPIYSISFNPLGDYFITSSLDNKIKIWKTKDLSLIREMEAFNQDLVPALFSRLSDKFLYAKSETMLSISSIEGEVSSIFIKDGIQMAKFTEKKDAIMVLTKKSHIEFYNIKTGGYLGTIPSIINFPITSFDINIVSGKILVGSSTGEIYLCDVNELKNIKMEDKKIPTKKNTIKGKEKTQQNAPLSNNQLEYLGLDDVISVQSPLRKPSFSIKDETPLEEPMEVLPQKPKEEKKVKISNKKEDEKTLDESVLENDDIDFTSNATDEEDRASDMNQSTENENNDGEDSEEANDYDENSNDE